VNKIFVYECKNGKSISKSLPLRFEVCHRCEGAGKHLCSRLEGRAITAEEFVDDPDFEEAYFGGRYDVTCGDCYGLRVVKVVAEELLNTSQSRFWEQVKRAEYEQEKVRQAIRTEAFYEKGGYWEA
jgi:hypothetical protein